jgi:hypothetical protein
MEILKTVGKKYKYFTRKLFLSRLTKIMLYEKISKSTNKRIYDILSLNLFGLFKSPNWLAFYWFKTLKNSAKLR